MVRPRGRLAEWSKRMPALFEPDHEEGDVLLWRDTTGSDQRSEHTNPALPPRPCQESASQPNTCRIHGLGQHMEPPVGRDG